MKNYLSKKRKIKPWGYAIIIAIAAHLIFLLVLFSPVTVENFPQSSNKVIMVPLANKAINKGQSLKVHVP